MKNLKKVLAFVVVFAMMFTFGVSASAFPDVADTASYAEATTILSSLGLMIGDDLGNFNPDKVLTRAEATALVMRAKGLENAAAGAAGATQFTDVPADHWATGYINLAAQSGVVAGYGNGLFGPEDQVLYEQFVKMIVAALGYEPMAAKNGGYPSGYLIVASQKNITKNAPGAAGQPAARSTVAVVLFNALEVNMMKQTVFTEGAEEYAEDPNLTLLDDYLHVDKYEGVVTGVEVAAAGEENLDTQITLSYTIMNGKNVVAYDEDGVPTVPTKTVDQAEAKNAAGLLGYSVVAYVGENEETREDELFAIAAKTGRNTTTTIDYTQLEGVAPVTADECADITVINYLAKATDKVATKVKVDLSKVFLNGKEAVAESAAEGDAFAFLSQTDSSIAGKAVLVDNDADNEAEYIFVTTYSAAAEYLVGEIDADNNMLIDKEGNDIADIDVESETISYTFYKNGAAASYEDIAVGDVLTVVFSDDGTVATVYISDVVVEGTVTETGYANGVPVYSINGVDYKVSTAESAPTVAINDEGKFYLNVDGRIAFKEAVSVSSDNYAYLLAAEATTGIGGSTVEIKFINAAGEWGIYELASRVSVYADGEDGYGYATVETKDDVADFGIVTTAIVGEDEAAKKVATIVEENRFFQYELNSAGKVKAIWTASATRSDDNFSEDLAPEDEVIYKASNNRLGTVYLGENTKVFSIKTAYIATADERAVTIATPAMFKDTEGYNAVFYDRDINGYPAAVVITNADAGIDVATHPLVLTKVTEGTNAAGYKVAKFYGYQAGEVVEAQGSEELVIVNDDDEIDESIEVSDLAAGDVVIFSLDAAGDIEKINVLFTAAEAAAALEDNTDVWAEGDEDEVMEYFGLVADKANGNRVTFYDGTEIQLRGADLNYYTVNINRTPANVAKGAYSDITATTDTTRTGRVASFVYVREFEGAPVAAVIYQVTYDEAVKGEYYPVEE